MQTPKFFPFQSQLQPGFWNSLANKKLEELKLSESPLPIWGSYTHSNPPRAQLSPRLCIEWNALDGAPAPSWNQFTLRGEVLLMNTVESFKKLDKSLFINKIGDRLWQSIESDGFWEDPTSVLSPFAVVVFADLKKFVFYYWFSFPAFNIPESISVEYTKRLDEVFAQDVVASITSASVVFNKDNPNSIYAYVSVENTNVVFHQLCEAKQANPKQTTHTSRNFLCVFDPCSTGEYPGWPVRNLVVALAVANPRLLKTTEILCMRVCTKEGQYAGGHSLVMSFKCSDEVLATKPSVVGWEKNEKNQLAPRCVNMRASMDPTSIAESSVDLNLKLMKWRLVPEINLDVLKTTKFLLLGSGTLGCGVARNLLAWGVRNITLLDNSKVSYSNPVRQSLYEFSDCLQGGQSKAVAAAKKLKNIFPGVNAKGVELSIPMPGHTISESTERQVAACHDQLAGLIAEHQVVFLLMDSRESRWLPTVMAACDPDKIVINAALGFDTYLVMRHGVRRLEEKKETTATISPPGLLKGEELGCYFCNDVVAPGDSMSDRTLDMQCTVTRPGASAIAAALAVELAVSLLEHPHRAAAPSVAPGAATTSPAPGSECVLGIVPHTIRGSLHTFSQFLPTAPAFSQCTACSPAVLQLYKDEGFELVKKVGSNPKYLEDITGLTELLNNSTLMDSVIGLDDDDAFSMTSGSDV